MNTHHYKEHEDLHDALIEALEKETNKKIFTIRVLDEFDDHLDIIAIFEDRNVLMGEIYIEKIINNIAFRIRGNWI